MLQGVKSLG
jgi:hypothetical protein